MSTSPSVISASRQSVLQRTLGVLGGGQLGRMMADAAHRLGVRIVVLDPTPNSPAGQAADKQIVGDFKNAECIAELAAECDVLTVEIEHVNVDALEASAAKCSIQPSPATIRIIQNKFVQKQHLHARGIALGEFAEVVAGGRQGVMDAAARFGYPLMLKAKCLAYDGRGNAVVKSEQDIDAAIASLSGAAAGGLYAEKWVPFTRELAVMVARGLDGKVVSYPAVETFQRNSICHTVVAPAQISGEILARAAAVAEAAIATFDGAGIFGVELFLLADGTVLLNEIAPRPHNSGHYTIEACHTSQFEQHIRAVMGLPLGSPAMRVGASVMVNVLGSGSSDQDFDNTWALCSSSLSLPSSTSIHWYGKEGVRNGRKVGHVTITGPFMPDVQAALRALGPSFADSPVLESTFKLAPVVSVIMGSDSDLKTMTAAAQILTQFGVPFELTIVSAHRTPQRMMDFAKTAHTRGIKVIIAAAGGAAHLPGMVAAITPLPVIGVPVPLSYLDGQDSLYSIVQMPRGVPVATVAIGNSTNAALLAVRILSVQAPSLLEKMIQYQESMEREVLGKVDKLEQVGWSSYTAAGH
ncbi:phosphoribosylaminoimidazole carboxylase [Capsaspora owczarzaki ATCC 30864]|uniref:phosphoribosylaminoimidazole carboxylase n=1 Tax=Capsaspora owczarzaki (strain ATCC 30864) TaxID=595528 RepID=A0A0D2WPZ8_CAPO3|nr:phosphoribosylaminoimidazole carboxylase [Capsaspora owczarzaki ATCC 30864]KJE92928.1 phosphoribosylaminoimidazole carboxylase [Capsaspora owczarzaki ATCC 30864]|eukprot:XP_004363538.1 phosphoribosylaminoimidazole carboxylase [Capsaspora owczarzaki ATCC 30864]